MTCSARLRANRNARRIAEAIPDHSVIRTAIRDGAFDHISARTFSSLCADSDLLDEVNWQLLAEILNARAWIPWRAA